VGGGVEYVTTVEISQLKSFAMQQLRLGSPLREVLISEPYTISPESFAERMMVWLRLAGMERCT